MSEKPADVPSLEQQIATLRDELTEARLELDWLKRRTGYFAVPAGPSKAAHHSPDIARAVIERFRSRYPNWAFSIDAQLLVELLTGVEL